MPTKEEMVALLNQHIAESQALLEQLDQPTTCQIYAELENEDGTPHAPCPNDGLFEVEPMPEGQFGPMRVCGEHIGTQMSEHEFHLGSEWFVRIVG